MEDDGTYVVYGSAVPQPEDDESVALKPKRVEEQIVTDAQGRRRFHGAFTGGFSAGYFNSVGTKEGRWGMKRSFPSFRLSVFLSLSLSLLLCVCLCVCVSDRLSLCIVSV